MDQDSWTFVVASGSSRHGQVHRWVGGAAFWAPDLAQIVLPPQTRGNPGSTHRSPQLLVLYETNGVVVSLLWFGKYPGAA